MIVDKVKNWELYFKKPIFKEIFKELNSFTLETPNGVYKTNESYYFKVMDYTTQLESQIIESHRKEVDIQILLEGKERIKIFDKKNVEVLKKYDLSTDCQFYKKNGTPESEIFLKPGYMAVFFPDDIHNPVLAVDNKVESLKKIVIKVNETVFS